MCGVALRLHLRCCCAQAGGHVLSGDGWRLRKQRRLVGMESRLALSCCGWARRALGSLRWAAVLHGRGGAEVGDAAGERANDDGSSADAGSGSGDGGGCSGEGEEGETGDSGD